MSSADRSDLIQHAVDTRSHENIEMLLHSLRLDQIQQLEQVLRDENQSRDVRLSDLGVNALDPTDVRHVGFVKDGEVLGVVAINVGIPEVHKLYVAPEHRSCGIGEALFDAALGVLRDEGFTEAMVEVLEGNDRFWARVFKRVQAVRIYDNRFSVPL